MLPGERSAEASAELYQRAIALAEEDAMLTLALEGLARIGHPRALELAEAQLSRESVRRDAALSMIAIARLTCGRDYDSAIAAIERALAACSEDEELAEIAAAAVEHVERNADYILDWRFAGPFRKAKTGGGELFDVAFPPEPDAADPKVEWRGIPMQAVVEPGIIDFLSIERANDCCCYLVTELVSAKAQGARLELGSDDGLKVWLNGEVVHANNAMRGLSLGSDVVEVELREGLNLLLLKITQGGGDWRASCRIRALDGTHLSGIE
jgi:hypothetical protein